MVRSLLLPIAPLAAFGAYLGSSCTGLADSGTCLADKANVAVRGESGVVMIQKGNRLTKRAPLAAGPSLTDDSLLERSDLDLRGEAEITVVTFNLYWWNVKKNDRWDGLFSRIREKRPFDLIGLQECEDIARTLKGSGLNNFEGFQGPFPNPAPLAWNADVFEKLDEPVSKWIAEDQWGNRWMNSVRLRHRQTGSTVLFVNTHGPLRQCTSGLGQTWRDGVRARKQPGDVVIMTGDYNCNSYTESMSLLKKEFTSWVDGGIDQILTTHSVASGGKNEGFPSDHPLVKGLLLLPAAEVVPASEPVGNHYRKVANVGAWGGLCTCPDGQQYNVGDNGDACGSLACEGGVAGSCQRAVDLSRDGMKVTCAAASATPAPGNNYRKVANVGGWGGTCTCPDGQQYNVGDNGDACGSLACDGGVAGVCERAVDPRREGMKVTCAATAAPTPTPAPVPGPASNYYRKVSNVGAWGGTCTCPDGQQYAVGDNSDACGSLACEGGSAGQCERVVDQSRAGMKVTCGAVPPALDCAAFAEWPHVDNGVVCGGCRALVLTTPFDSCEKYCASFGHRCADAAEEVDETCEAMDTKRCDEPIEGTSDMLCTCVRQG